MTTYLFIDIEAAGPEGSTENDRPDSATWVPLQLGVTEQSGHSKFWDVAASSPVTLTEFHEKHKITATGVSWEEAVQELVSLMDGIDGPVALVAHNGWGFDFPLLERLAPQVLAGRILIDSLGLTRYWRPWSKNTLDQLVMDFCVPVKQMMPEDSSSHNAEVDACLLSLVWEAFTSGRWVSEWFSGQTPETLSSLSHQVHTSREAYYSWKFVIPGADCFRRNRDGYMALYFGKKYKYGTPLLDVPPNYFRWIQDNATKLSDADRQILSSWLSTGGGVLTEEVQAGPDIKAAWQGWYKSAPPEVLTHPGV